MKFEWDEEKRQSNLRKHHLDFVDAASVFTGPTFTFEDQRFEYAETRYITVGLLHTHVVVIAHTEHGETIRVISMRKATKNEQRRYFRNFED